MAKYEHTGIDTDAAEDGRHEKYESFRNTLDFPFPDGLSFIIGHDEEGNDVYDDQKWGK